ncbi:hypothetical protein D3C71_2117850 [compost metagenome]
MGVAGLDAFQIARHQLLGQQRNRRLGRDDQIGLGIPQGLGVPLQRHRHTAADLKFFVLRDIALEQFQSQRGRWAL